MQKASQNNQIYFQQQQLNKQETNKHISTIVQQKAKPNKRPNNDVNAIRTYRKNGVSYYDKITCKQCGKQYSGNSQHLRCNPLLLNWESIPGRQGARHMYKCLTCGLLRRSTEIATHKCKQSINTPVKQSKKEIIQVSSASTVNSPSDQKKNTVVTHLPQDTTQKPSQQVVVIDVQLNAEQQTPVFGQDLVQFERQIEPSQDRLLQFVDLPQHKQQQIMQQQKKVPEQLHQVGRSQTGHRIFEYQFTLPSKFHGMQTQVFSWQSDDEQIDVPQMISTDFGLPSKVNVNLLKQTIQGPRADCSHKIQLMALASLVKFLASVKKQDAQLWISTQNHTRCFNYQKFVQRTAKILPVIRAFPKLFRSHLLPYITFLNQHPDYAYVHNFPQLVIGLRDLAQNVNFNQLYIGGILNTVVKRPQNMQSVKKRGSIKDQRPQIRKIRRALAQRKHARKRRNTQGNPNKVPRISKLAHINQQMNRRMLSRLDRFSKRQRVLSGRSVNKNKSQRKSDIMNALKDGALEQCTDYLVCSQFLKLLVKADKNDQSEKLKLYRYTAGNSQQHTQFIKQFRPYVPRASQFQEVSQSTVADKNNLAAVCEIYNQYMTQTQHPLKDSGQISFQPMTPQTLYPQLLCHLQTMHILKPYDSFALEKIDMDLLGVTQDFNKGPSQVHIDTLSLDKIVPVHPLTIQCSTCDQWILGNSKIFVCNKCGAQYHQSSECAPVPFCSRCPTKEAAPFATEPYYFPIEQTHVKQLDLYGAKKLFKQGKPPLFVVKTVWRSMVDLIANSYYGKKFVTQNKFNQDFVYYPSFNVHLRLLSKTDQDHIRRFRRIPQQCQYQQPLPICPFQQNIKGWGAYSAREIKKNQFLGFYAGNVVNLAWIKANNFSQHALQLVRGPSAFTTFCVVPFDHMGVGPVLNYASQKQANVRMLHVITREFGPELLLIAKRDIAPDKELTWNYNGKYDMYNTQGFV